MNLEPSAVVVEQRIGHGVGRGVVVGRVGRDMHHRSGRGVLVHGVGRGVVVHRGRDHELVDVVEVDGDGLVRWEIDSVSSPYCQSECGLLFVVQVARVVDGDLTGGSVDGKCRI